MYLLGTLGLEKPLIGEKWKYKGVQVEKIEKWKMRVWLNLKLNEPCRDQSPGEQNHMYRIEMIYQELKRIGQVI